MAKVVKFCAACEEGFAEKFGFCPNCGGALTAYELNPVAEKPSVEAPKKFEAKAPAPVVLPVVNESPAPVPASVIETPAAVEPEVAQEFSAIDDDDEFLEFNDVPEVEPEKPAPAIAAAATAASFTPSYSAVNQSSSSSDNGYQKTTGKSQTKYGDGAYHITFVEEKNASGRNLLLLGAFLLITSTVFGGLAYSLFAKNLAIAALGNDDSIMAYIGAVEPEPAMEVEPPPKKNDKAGGGGGGGGREEETPTSQGRLAPQMRATPMLTPTKTIEQKDFELKMQATTVGDKQVKATDEKYGDPTSKYNLSSDGMGQGGGQGSGRGSGQGSGRGTGQGSGTGSGSGSGIGDGNGGGRGNGDGDDNEPPKPKPAGPPEPMKIISKPRPSYTDAARQNQVTGVVRLKVTFMANGTIGSVTPVSGLSYGLTEQAIAAAKQIKFEPQKVGGQPQTVSKTIEYSFSIY